MIVSPYLKRRLRTIEEAQAEAERLARLAADQDLAPPEEPCPVATEPARKAVRG
jgi:hypothetical protein